VAETEVGLPSARPPLAATGRMKLDAQSIHELAKREEADVVVLGMPLEEDGMQGKMARIVRLLGDQLVSLGMHIDFVDERYTSIEADKNLRSFDLKASERRKQRDSEAASVILERYLEARK
jgi:putative holliday junction resolvase